MNISYSHFEMPKEIRLEDSPREGNKLGTRLTAEPLERGFGHTLGNALRRLMLSSLESPAIVAVRISGIDHEYMTLPGVIEDMTRIVLNLKRVKIRALTLPEDTITVSREIEVTESDLQKGEKEITIGDVVADAPVSVVDRKHVIFTATTPQKRKIELQIRLGRGYIPAEPSSEIGMIPIDAIFTPVLRANYLVEQTRVGRRTDFDRLLMEITTDGRITPQEAVSFAIQILSRHLTMFDNIHTSTLEFRPPDTPPELQRSEVIAKLAMRIEELELSANTVAAIALAGIDSLGELITISQQELLEKHSFTHKNIDEIREKLIPLGFRLGMDLARFEIDKQQLAAVIATHRQ